MCAAVKRSAVRVREFPKADRRMSGARSERWGLTSSPAGSPGRNLRPSSIYTKYRTPPKTMDRTAATLFEPNFPRTHLAAGVSMLAEIRSRGRQNSPQFVGEPYRERHYSQRRIGVTPRREH